MIVAVQVNNFFVCSKSRQFTTVARFEILKLVTVKLRPFSLISIIIIIIIIIIINIAIIICICAVKYKLRVSFNI